MNFVRNRFALILAILIAAISILTAVCNAINYGNTLTALPLRYHIGIPLAEGLLLILLEYALIRCGKIFSNKKNK